MQYLSQKYNDKIIYISLLFVCLSIYLIPLLKGLSITLLLLSIILSYISKSYNIKENLKFNQFNISFIVFYLLYVIGLFYSFDKKEAYFDLEVKLPILLFPIISFFIPKKYITKTYLWYFALNVILGLILYILYRFGFGITRAIKHSLPIIPQISYCNLTNYPSYFALISSITLILTHKIPLMSLFKIKNKTSYSLKLGAYSIITIFFLFLNSTSGLLCITIAYLSIILDMYFIEKNRIGIILPVIIIISFYSLVFNLNSFNDRYKYYAKVELKTQKKDGSQRKFILTNAHKIIIKSSLFGIGTGDVRVTINELYKNNGVNFSRYYNAHNQFLQTDIALGLLGLGYLLYLFILPFVKARRQKEYFILTIIILFGTSFLFESMLEQHMGVYFFSFMYIWFSHFLESTE